MSHRQSAIVANDHAFVEKTLQFLHSSDRKAITQESISQLAAFWRNPVCARVFVVKIS